MIVALGFGAGATTMAGLVVAGSGRWSSGARVRLSAIAAGVLLFLLAEALDELVETVTATGTAGATIVRVALALAITAGTVAGFGAAQRRTARGGDATQAAWMIAIALGAHNFTEGLVLAQAARAGAIQLAWLLAGGFALHNFTEAFAIMAPYAGGSDRPGWRRLVGVGVVAAAPTAVGAAFGAMLSGPWAFTIALAAAAGSVLYVAIVVAASTLRQLDAGVLARWAGAGVSIGVCGAVALELAGA